MAQARRQNKRQGGSGAGLPGWAMLTIGLIIGLFVAFLVYLDDMDRPPNAAVQSPESNDATEPQAAADSSDAEGEFDGPRFEFYSILPELEVVVPEFGRRSDDDGDGPAATAPAPTADDTEDDGRYYLQAGSFREAKQADRMKAEIALLGLDVAIQDVQVNGEQWHRVRVGPYTSTSALEAAQQRLRENEIEHLVMREKNSG